VIVIEHEELTEEIPVYDWLFSHNRAEEYLYSLLKRREHSFN